MGSAPALPRSQESESLQYHPALTHSESQHLDDLPRIAAATQRRCLQLSLVRFAFAAQQRSASSRGGRVFEPWRSLGAALARSCPRHIQPDRQSPWRSRALAGRRRRLHIGYEFCRNRFLLPRYTAGTTTTISHARVPSASAYRGRQTDPSRRWRLCPRLRRLPCRATAAQTMRMPAAADQCRNAPAADQDPGSPPKFPRAHMLRRAMLRPLLPATAQSESTVTWTRKTTKPDSGHSLRSNAESKRGAAEYAAEDRARS